MATRTPLGSVVTSSSSAGSWGGVRKYQDELDVNLQDFQLVALRRTIFEEGEVMPGVFSAPTTVAGGLLKVMNGAFCGMLNDVALGFSRQILTRFAM